MSGRGQYYKNRYGRGGKGGGRGRGSSQPPRSTHASIGTSRDWQQLQSDLRDIDRQQYGAYKCLLGQYMHNTPPFKLSVDYVQGDPYASPSRVSAIIPWNETALPNEYQATPMRRIALCDFVTRAAAEFLRTRSLDRNVQESSGWSGPKGGAFNINSPGQEVLPRSSALISEDGLQIELRFTVSLPAAGRTIQGQEAWQILGVNLVQLVTLSLLYQNLDQRALKEHIESVERQEGLRNELQDQGLVAFIPNGAILPRVSGSAALPMPVEKVVPFRSPKEIEVVIACPDGRKVNGMGFPRGITLLTGGGFHGKSTILEAIELGIYNHIPSDGREAVVSDPTAVKIRAEDGRAVSGVDITPFISTLPGHKDTTRFVTEDASGSTSMATNLVEALEMGAKTLLIDEDSSATNLLVRDERMRMLVEKEPITPFICKARALWEQHGISTVIVVGGLGDWLEVADTVIKMDEYRPQLVTSQARTIVQAYKREVQQDQNFGRITERKIRVNLSAFKSPLAMRKGYISLKRLNRNPVPNPAEAEEGISLESVDQIVEIGQARRIAALLEEIARRTGMATIPFTALVAELGVDIGQCMTSNIIGGDQVAVRRFELAAAVARMRGLIVEFD